jgi:hypothetical protein
MKKSLFFRGHLGLAVWCGVSHCVEDRVAISRCLFLVSSVREISGTILEHVWEKTLPHVANNLEMHLQNVIQPLSHL